MTEKTLASREFQVDVKLDELIDKILAGVASPQERTYFEELSALRGHLMHPTHAFPHTQTIHGEDDHGMEAAE